MKAFTGLTTTMLPSNGTDIMVNKEMQVETVIVILWISGGILLIALIILLACILRTNKKGRRRSNPLRPGVFRVLESANGGVNPSYTSYDEIWTWIPVVRGDEASCPPRQETSRNVTISPASTSLASNLEPPSYSVAISTPSRPHSIPRYSSAAMAVSTATTSSYGNPGNAQIETPPFTYDPEEGVYSYLAGSIGRRIWCDIPPSLLDEDGPPPYTRNADLRSREYYQRRPRTDRPAPLVRLEYDYF